MNLEVKSTIDETYSNSKHHLDSNIAKSLAAKIHSDYKKFDDFEKNRRESSMTQIALASRALGFIQELKKVPIELSFFICAYLYSKSYILTRIHPMNFNPTPFPHIGEFYV